MGGKTHLLAKQAVRFDFQAGKPARKLSGVDGQVLARQQYLPVVGFGGLEENRNVPRTTAVFPLDWICPNGLMSTRNFGWQTSTIMGNTRQSD